MDTHSPIENTVKGIEYAKRVNDERMRLLYGDEAEAVVTRLREQAVEREKRHQAYMRRVLRFAVELENAVDKNRVAQKVYDLHEPSEYSTGPYCEQCYGGEGDYAEWPCDTIKAIAGVLDVEVPVDR